MTITITAQHMNCDHLPPQADVTLSGDEYDTRTMGTMGWLPDGPLDRNRANTATILTETRRTAETYTLSRWSPHAHNQAGELSSATADAAARTSITPHVNAGAAGGAQ
jgi:hypothetical protein